MVKEIVACEREDCGLEYEKKAHNQKYCSPECTRIVTNKRILEQYHNKKKLRTNKRTCKECSTILSIYNDGKLCALHEKGKYE